MNNPVARNSVTIDNYPADVAIEYAQNIDTYKAHYVAPAALFELTTIMTQFAEIEKVFGLMRRRSSWAKFSPPPQFFRQLDRFYRTAIIPFLSSLQIHNLMEEHIDLPPRVEQMLLTVDELNRWLEEILCRVLEYRKG